MKPKITSKKVDEMMCDIHDMLGDASDTHALCTSIALTHELVKPENAEYFAKYEEMRKAVYDRRIPCDSEEFDKRCDARMDYVEELIEKLVPENRLYVWRLPPKPKKTNK